MRVAIAFDNFGPYHLARLSGASEHMTVLAVEVVSRSAEYAWDRAAMPEALLHVPLTESAAQKRDAKLLWAALDRKLAPLAPQAVAVPAWSSLAALVLTRWSFAKDIPVIAMSETNGWDFERKPWGEFFKRCIVSHYSAGLCTSEGQADYLASLGLPAQAIFRGYNAVDNAYFAHQGQLFAVSGKMPDCGESVLPAEARGRYFLGSNRFIEKKNLLRLLDAYAAFRADRSSDPADWPLVLLGDGPLRPEIEARREALGLSRHVHLPGFRQYDELPTFYATAGCFIHASTTEQWGLVVNEAMASGLPVLVSNRCGCVPVLVDEGRNGFTFDPLDTAAMAAALERIASLKSLAAMRERSLELIEDWGPARFGAGLYGAARHAIAAGAARPSLARRAAFGLVERRMGSW
jgi:glycosyltransferase involved in cell wall biosynthesis